MKNVVFILGPTGVGKTFFSVLLAKQFDGEIISADSVQIFKQLDIGSAKVTKEEMQGVPHHAIDICEPHEEFSVFDFVEYTKEKITEISSRGKLPIVVGGTGLYVKALTLGYDFGGTQKNESLREELEVLAEKEGLGALFEMLEKLNSDMAKQTDPHNKVRLVRAIEIASADADAKKGKSKPFEINPIVFALNKPREDLYDGINKRVDIMLENGLIEEVKSLKNKGLSLENQSMKAIGYKEVLSFLDGEISYDRMVEILKQHSRNYAKRQLTFLRGMTDVNFVDVQDLQKAKSEIFAKIKENQK